MSADRRILVVEDTDQAREAFTNALRLQGHYVDSARNLDEALRAIEATSYHVALVDIKLAGQRDHTNQDGLLVLRRLQELEEGTAAIVLSGQDSRALVRDTWKEYGARDYIDKDEIETFDEVIRIINLALDDSTLKLLPLRKTLLGLLFTDSGTETMAIKAVGLNGYPGLRSLFEALCEPILPCLVPVGLEPGDSPAMIDEEQALVTIVLWSKAIGEAVLVVVAKDGGTGCVVSDLSSLGFAEAEIGAGITEVDQQGVSGRVYQLAGLERAAFVEVLD